MDVVVKGHHCEVSDRFRQYVEEKLERIEKVDHRVLRCEVEVSQEKNPRQHDRAMRVELAMYTKGPVVRAEACGETKQAAFAEDKVATYKVGSLTVTGDGPLVMREKTHTAKPMSLDQALYELELVGHDFYLFVDADENQPSVVYRSRGYDYGVISLAV